MIKTLSSMRYPGRFLAIGKDGDAHVVLYGATGRSPSSLARTYVQDGNAIYARGIDDTVRREGNPELLEYPAIVFLKNGVVVANGRQIERVTELQDREAKKQLSYLLSEEAYEPDEYRTPRITGCIVETSQGMDGAIHIARSVSDGIDRSAWTVPLEEGKGMYISTYVGGDVRPTPSFPGDPLPVSFNFGSAQKAAQAMFDALTPPADAPDYRIGYIAVYLREGQSPEIAIVNKLRS